MEKSLLIEEVTEADLAAMEVLYTQSVRANPAGFIQNLSYHGDIKTFARRVQNDGGRFAVGKVGDAVIAMGALRIYPDRPKRAELCKLHVAAAHQGKGYGRMMSRYFLEQAEFIGLEEIVLHVTTSQKAAIGLYDKLGFLAEEIEQWEGHIAGRVEIYETQHMRRVLA